MPLDTTNNLLRGGDEAANENPYAATMRQAFELWLNPEIEHRRQTGRLPNGFSLYAAQVIMDMDTDAPYSETKRGDQGRLPCPTEEIG
jgi:hypothetical protein